jgi:hypothetical protein
MAPTKSATTTEIPEIAVTFSEQVLSSVKQFQQFSIDAAQSFAKATSVLPVSGFTDLPGLPSAADVDALTTFAFGFSLDLLNAQRDFALQLTNVLVPTKAA